MLFNSIDFVYFFVIASVLFYALKHKYRWLFLLASSYFFYMCWNPLYIILIAISTIVDYVVAIGIDKCTKQWNKKLLLWLSLFVNLGLLFYFKYYNFLAVNVEDLFSFIGLHITIPKEDFLLPVGISFYTFQTLSYTLDVYLGKRKPERHLGVFAVFVSFFPQLVAGPIEKSVDLLPQFRKKQSFKYENVFSGVRLMAWGFFKKIVIADRLAIYVDQVYNNPSADYLNSVHFLIAGVFFAFQIYCDFSGYSDIAIGGARVLGFNLTLNFRSPYFSKSITELWTRWHISLMLWIREYLFMPLTMALRNSGPFFTTYALILTFVIVGVWHGANWTFIVFGLIHGSILSIESFAKRYINTDSMPLPKYMKSLGNVFYTFIIWSATLIIFRSNTLSDSYLIFSEIFSLKFSYFSAETFNTFIQLFPAKHLGVSFFSLVVLMIIEYLHANKRFMPMFTNLPIYLRWSSYLAIGFITVVFAINNEAQFIYFQF